MTLKSTSTSEAESAEVGSSMMRMRLLTESARAISTICCWPRRSSSTGVQRVDLLLELGHQRAGLALLLGEVDAAGGADLAAHEDVVADAEVGREARVPDG